MDKNWLKASTGTDSQMQRSDDSPQFSLVKRALRWVWEKIYLILWSYLSYLTIWIEQVDQIVLSTC